MVDLVIAQLIRFQDYSRLRNFYTIEVLLRYWVLGEIFVVCVLSAVRNYSEGMISRTSHKQPKIIFFLLSGAKFISVSQSVARRHVR